MGILIRTNIVLNDQLVARAMKKANVRTKREAVEAALKAYVQTVDWDGLLALRGAGLVRPDYNPKADADIEPRPTAAAPKRPGGQPRARRAGKATPA